MSKQYYECHVTMVGVPSFIKYRVEARKWKFSCISGDPTLGAGVKCYATRHYNSKHFQQQVLDELNKTADALAASGCKVIRRKIEFVIYDDRGATVRCDGACPECHTDDLATVFGSG